MMHVCMESRQSRNRKDTPSLASTAMAMVTVTVMAMETTTETPYGIPTKSQTSLY